MAEFETNIQLEDGVVLLPESNPITLSPSDAIRYVDALGPCIAMIGVIPGEGLRYMHIYPHEEEEVGAFTRVLHIQGATAIYAFSGVSGDQRMQKIHRVIRRKGFNGKFVPNGYNGVVHLQIHQGRISYFLNGNPHPELFNYDIYQANLA